MKTNEILQGNRILAEFMEYEAESQFGTMRWHTGFNYEECGDSWTDLYEDGELRFHLSWDWLMPVVEKIESLGYAVLICYARVVIECCVMSDKTVIYKNDNNSIPKIKNAFLACVEFAKWYKNQSKQIKA